LGVLTRVPEAREARYERKERVASVKRKFPGTGPRGSEKGRDRRPTTKQRGHESKELLGREIREVKIHAALAANVKCY